MIWTCGKCGRSINAPVGIPVYCSCGTVGVCPKEKLAEAGRLAWLRIHSYPKDHWEDWDPVKAKQWYVNEWLPLVPSFGCDCQSYWLQLTLRLPPTFESPEAFYQWTVDRHNDINTKLEKPRWTPV